LLLPAAIAGGVLVVAAAGQWWLARPPDKGIDWALKPPSPEADAAFGTALDEWSRIRLRWDDRVREESSATAMVELKAAERKLKEGAAPLDANVRTALTALLLDSQDLDLAGRGWFRLVADLNEASRAAGAPYYVDPSVVMYQTPDGLRRRFSAHGYRIERVRPVRVDGERFATLHVRRLGARAGTHGLLGFSRDLQPFALVVLDEIEPTEKELAALVESDSPSCSGESPFAALALPGFGSDSATFGAIELERAMLDCGRAVADIAKRDPKALLPALVALTERHELQHQIDGPHLPLPSALLDRMGGYTDAAQELVSRELSAYVAELTTPDASPKLGLIALLRFTRASPRSALHHVSVLTIEALSGKDLTNALGGSDPNELARAYNELFALDDEALRKRARDAWEELYEDELPEIVRE
jgi:hypothetical protein